MWRICQSKSRREVVVFSRGECARNARIAGKHEPGWRIRENLGLLAHDQRFYEISRVIPGRARLPAQSIIQGKAWPYPPTVLRVQAIVFAACVLNVGTSLNEGTGGTDQKIRKINARLRPRKSKLPIFRGETNQVNLIVVNVHPEL